MMPTDNPRGNQPVSVATRADGTSYRFEMILGNGAERVYADTLTDLLGALIPGYTDADNTQADELRLRHAIDTQVRVQAMLCTPDALAECTPEQRELLLGDRHVPPVLDGSWSGAVPLVLVDVFYEPTGPRSRPDGNIIWLSPLDEASYLDSLAAADTITLSEHESSLP